MRVTELAHEAVAFDAEASFEGAGGGIEARVADVGVTAGLVRCWAIGGFEDADFEGREVECDLAGHGAADDAGSDDGDVVVHEGGVILCGLCPRPVGDAALPDTPSSTCRPSAGPAGASPRTPAYNSRHHGDGASDEDTY